MFRFMTKERGADAVEEEGGSVGWAMRGPPAPLRQGRAVRHAGRRGAVSLKCMTGFDPAPSRACPVPAPGAGAVVRQRG
jgi:hypothetical protein